jgi:O-antigen/teichoic acid export membrane protein
MSTIAEAEPRFWRDNTLLNAGALLAGVANVLYHVIVARMLGPVNYGVLTALGTVVLVAEIPVSVVALVYTRRGARPGDLGRLNLRYVLAGFAMWTLLALFRIPVSRLFHLPPGLLILFGLAVVPAYAYGLNVGLLQWAGQFAWAAAAIAWDAVGATLGALGTYLGGFGLLGLVVVGPLVSLTDIAVSWVGARTGVRFAASRGLASFGALWNAGGVGMLALVLTSADVLAAKHALPPRAAGYYGGLATIGRAPMFFAGSIGTVLLSSTQRSPERGPRYLFYSIMAMLGLGVLGMGLYALGGPLVIQIALGARFLPIARELLPYTAAMVGQGLIVIALYYGAARGRTALTVFGLMVFLAWMAAIWVGPTLPVIVDWTVAIMGIGALGSLLGATLLPAGARVPAVTNP